MQPLHKPELVRVWSMLVCSTFVWDKGGKRRAWILVPEDWNPQRTRPPLLRRHLWQYWRWDFNYDSIWLDFLSEILLRLIFFSFYCIGKTLRQWLFYCRPAVKFRFTADLLLPVEFTEPAVKRSFYSTALKKFSYINTIQSSNDYYYICSKTKLSVIPIY